MPLLSLPNELLIQVGKGLDPCDLDHFIRTNHRFATLLTPVLDKLAMHNRILPWASGHGHQRLVSSLLDLGNDIEEVDLQGWSPLMLAVTGGHVAVVQTLLNSGANIEYQMEQTALHCAVKKSKEEVAKVLLERGADIEAKEVNNGWSPLHFAATHQQSVMTRLLLEKGANINAHSITGETALQVAARCGNVETFELLLDKGADITTSGTGLDTDPTQKPTIHRAVLGGSERIVRLLLERGVDITARNDRDQTVLHMAAAENADEKVLQLLLESGAEVLVNSREATRGGTPLFDAVWGEKRFSREEPALYAPEPDTTEYNEYLVARTETNSKKIIQLLLDKGSIVDLGNELHETPLHHAAKSGYAEIVQILLENGSNVAAIDSEGRTPLHWAAKGSLKYLYSGAISHIVVMKLLLNAGADINSADFSNKTVRGWASSENTFLCDLLEEMGQDVAELREREYLATTSDELWSDICDFPGGLSDLDDYQLEDDEVEWDDEDDEGEEISWDGDE